MARVSAAQSDLRYKYMHPMPGSFLLDTLHMIEYHIRQCQENTFLMGKVHRKHQFLFQRGTDHNHKGCESGQLWEDSSAFQSEFR